jgi:hypothetical protein
MVTILKNNDIYHINQFGEELLVYSHREYGEVMWFRNISQHIFICAEGRLYHTRVESIDAGMISTLVELIDNITDPIDVYFRPYLNYNQLNYIIRCQNDELHTYSLYTREVTRYDTPRSKMIRSNERLVTISSGVCEIENSKIYGIPDHRFVVEVDAGNYRRNRMMAVVAVLYEDSFRLFKAESCKNRRPIYEIRDLILIHKIANVTKLWLGDKNQIISLTSDNKLIISQYNLDKGIVDDEISINDVVDAEYDNISTIFCITTNNELKYVNIVDARKSLLRYIFPCRLTMIGNLPPDSCFTKKYSCQNNVKCAKVVL